MLRIYTVFFLLFILIINSYSQSYDGSYYCQSKKSAVNSLPFNEYYSINSPGVPKHKYDVLHYNISADIRNSFISPYPKNFNGNVIISFRIDTALNQIDLHAVNTSLQINSVSMAGVSFTHTNNQLLVNLDRTYNPGETASVKINYQHLNVSDQAFYASNGFVFTDFPPEGARKFFPCYDRPFDKATVEITAKVPANVKLGSNGKLIDSTLTGDSLYYHWKSKDPIATYLIVLSSKVNYNLDIIYWQRLSNPLDTVPVRFYYNAGENPSIIKNLTGNLMTNFSQRFGEYPFEKNGYATLNNQFPWGGMENQTLISLCQNCWQEALVVHEFAHQWFGDLVTCGTWADVWLNEGFATYCEALWLEHTGGYSAYKNKINQFSNQYLTSNPGWPMYNPSWAVSTPPAGTLYNYAITYLKGSGVLHMMRYVLGDSVFNSCIKAYATDTLNFKYKAATTDDFAAKVSQVSGQDMSWFIDSWVKQPNHPVYQNNYSFMNNGGNNWTVNFLAKQIQTNTPFHKMPLTIKIVFTSGPDSLIRFMNDSNNQSFTFNFNRQPSTLTFDPNNDIVLKQGTTSYNGFEKKGESIPEVFSLSQNYPNPFNPVTKIRFSIPNNTNLYSSKADIVNLVIFNSIGQEIAIIVNQGLEPGEYEAEWNALGFASGIYYYRLSRGSMYEMKKMVLLK